MSEEPKPRCAVSEDGTLYFRCPGCQDWHTYHGDGWNGDTEKPTIWGVITTVMFPKMDQCQCRIINGQVRFTEQTAHELHGQTVELPEWKDEFAPGRFAQGAVK